MKTAGAHIENENYMKELKKLASKQDNAFFAKAALPALSKLNTADGLEIS